MKSKGGGTVAYRMYVMARDAAELATRAGGLIVDRRMSGWQVSVQLLEAVDARAVQILGAEVVEMLSIPQEDEQCVLVTGAQLYAETISDGEQRLLAGCSEILLWGESADPSDLFGHTLSAAARVFKAQAAGVSPDTVGAVETFTSMKAKVGITRRA